MDLGPYLVVGSTARGPSLTHLTTLVQKGGKLDEPPLGAPAPPVRGDTGASWSPTNSTTLATGRKEKKEEDEENCKVENG